MARKWMQEAFAGAHGQFKAKAKAAGMSTAAYANKEAGAPGRLGKQARLAKVGMAASRGRRKRKGGNPMRSAVGAL
jgi:hypothetical protein